MGRSSPSSEGNGAPSSSGAPGWGQPQRARPDGDRACQRRWVSLVSASAGRVRSVPLRRNWQRALGSSQANSTEGCCLSSPTLALRASVSKSRAAASAQPRNTKVRILGVPSAATVASCSQRAWGRRPSRSRAPRSRGRQGGSGGWLVIDRSWGPMAGAGWGRRRLGIRALAGVAIACWP